MKKNKDNNIQPVNKSSKQGKNFETKYKYWATIGNGNPKIIYVKLHTI